MTDVDEAMGPDFDQKDVDVFFRVLRRISDRIAIWNREGHYMDRLPVEAIDIDDSIHRGLIVVGDAEEWTLNGRALPLDLLVMTEDDIKRYHQRRIEERNREKAVNNDRAERDQLLKLAEKYPDLIESLTGKTVEPWRRRT